MSYSPRTEGGIMEIIVGDFQFPVNESPVPIKRKFPDPVVVDGFATPNISLVRVPFTDPEKYDLSVWSSFERLGFRITPRQDIDLKLAQFNLPPSDYLLRNHEVVKQDDLDQHLDYRDPNSYGFVVELDRSEVVGYYKLMTTSPFLQDNITLLNFMWIWRDLPIDCEDDYNFLLYHYPQEMYDIGAPVTRTEMLALFREVFPDAGPDCKLRVMADGNSGFSGNLFIVEDLSTEEDEDVGRLRLNRLVVLDPTQYIPLNESTYFLYGISQVPPSEGEVENEDADPESGDCTDDADETDGTLNFGLFGDSDQEVYVDDLLGPDYEQDE